MTEKLENRLLLTTREAADRLAVSERTLWDLTHRGDLACVRIGRSVRYDPADLTSWIVRQKTKVNTPKVVE